jgi:hypothetical protein
LHRFQAVSDTFLLFAQAYQHAASLAACRTGVFSQAFR